MAKLYITEYAEQGRDSNGAILPVGMEPAIAAQGVSIGASSTASSAFNGNTRFVLLHTDAICSVAFGVSPTAVATANRMGAGESRFYGVLPGHKVAVITNT